jgi:hypothetical protein
VSHPTRVLWALSVVIVALLGAARRSEACGAFAGPRGPSDAELYARTPYLAVEQSLIVWDKDTFTEDFIREARFAKTGQAFGFVVPTPGLPEVSKVDASPFAALRKAYPFMGPTTGDDVKGGAAGGGGGSRDAASVEVFSQQRVGSFDVTVLRATDAGSLDGWLAQNGFAMTTEARPWLRHYVELRFFFVAFRYAAPPENAADGMTSETVRIRFKSAAPFYPYLEPEHPAGTLPPGERMLSAWLVTQESMVPVVNNRAPGGPHWRRPLVESDGTTVLAANFVAHTPGLEGNFPIRSKNVRVQPFRDLRTSRVGLGDILFAYRTPHTASRDDLAALRPLLPILDPSLPSADPLLVPEKKRSRCTATPGVAEPDAVALSGLVVVAVLGGVRRRRRATKGARLAVVIGCLLLAALAVGCRRGKPVDIADAKSGAVIDVLLGRHPNIQWAREAKVVTTVTIDDATIDGTGTTPNDRLTRQLLLGQCFRADAPHSIGVTFDVRDNGRINAASVKLEGPATETLRACLASELFGLTFPPPNKPAQGRLRLTVTQSFFVPAL